MPGGHQGPIFTRQVDVATFSDPGQVRLGGVWLYGASQEPLEAALHALEADVEQLVRASPTADRKSVIALLRADRSDLDRRVAAAVFGSVLRQGRLSAFCGEDEKDELTMIVCAPERRPIFDGRVSDLCKRLRADGEVAIRDLRDSVFPAGGSGAWTWSWHIAARAAYLGCARFLDRYHVVAGEEFADVLGASG